MARLLSSRWTFFMKYIFPPLWIGGFGVLTLLLFYAPQHFLSKDGNPPTTLFNNVMVIAWVVGSTFILYSSLPLKRVHLDGNRLIVSNFRREARIPLSDIAVVTQTHWSNVRPIHIAFRNKTPFGRRIQFMPPQRIRRLRFWRDDPVVAELRELSIPVESADQYANASPTIHPLQHGPKRAAHVEVERPAALAQSTRNIDTQ